MLKPSLPPIVRSTLVLTLATMLAAAAGGCRKDPVERGQAHMRRGDAYVAAGETRNAIIEYRAAVGDMPMSPQAHYKLAEAYGKLSEVQNALPEYVRAADLDPALTDAWLKAGNLLLLARKYEDAKARARGVLERDPKDVGALLLLGNALAGLRSFDEAVAANERAIALAPERAGAYINLGAVQFIQGNTQDAFDAYRSAVDADPKSIEAHVGLGTYYWLTGNGAEAEREFKTAVALGPTDTNANKILAGFYVSTGRAALAEAYVKAIATANPSAEAQFMLADYYSGIGRRDASIEILTRLKSDPEARVPATLRLALASYTRGRHEEAASFLDEVLGKDPKNPTALAFKAHMLLAEGKRTEAGVAADAAVNADPQSARAQFARGVVARASGRTDVAQQAFGLVLQLNPGAVEAQMELADLHVALRQPETALSFAEAAVKNSPGSLETHLALLRVLMTRPDWLPRADAIIKPMLVQFPRSSMVYTAAGRVALARRDAAGAARAFTRAVELDAADPDPLVELLRIDLTAGRVDAVRQRVEAAVAAHPDSSAILLVAGKALADTDRTTAERYLRKAIERDGSNFEAYETLAALYLAQQQLPQARAEFIRLSEQQPGAVAPVTMVGMLSEALGETEEAKKWYDRALRIDPRSATASNNLAWLYAEKGEKLDVALQLAQAAHQELPKQLEITDTLGWVYYKKGLYTQAIRALQDCVQFAPRNPIYHYHLGLAHAANGEDRRARIELESALKIDPGFQGAADARRVIQRLVY